MMIAIVHHSVVTTPVLVATKHCSTEVEAVNYINEMVENWYKNGQSLAEELGGAFDIDGLPKGECMVFNSFTDEFLVTANNNEEMFTAAIDAATLGK